MAVKPQAMADVFPAVGRFADELSAANAVDPIANTDNNAAANIVLFMVIIF